MKESAMSLARITLPRGGRVVIQMWDVIDAKPICFSVLGGAEVIVEQAVIAPTGKDGAASARTSKKRKG